MTDKDLLSSQADALRKQAEEALRESEQKLSIHLENSPLATIEWDSNFIVTRWAGEAEKMFGWNRMETIGRPIMDLQMIYQEDVPIVQQVMQCLTDGVSKHVVSANRNYTRDGKVIYCEWYNSVVLDPQGKMVSVLSQVLDITERKLAEAKIDRYHNQFETFFRKHDAVFLLMNGNTGQIVDVNDAALRFYGYSLPQMKLLKIGDINQLPPDELNAERQRAVREERKYFVVPHRLANGEIRIVEVHTTPVVWTNEIYLFSVIHDVTERKRAEKTLRRALREKEVLLKEVHHRVKNNLQIIHSLLNLQAKEIDNPVLRIRFEESRNQVAAIAMIHEQLYRLENLSRIDFKPYLQSLVHGIAATYQRPEIEVAVEMKDVSLDLNAAIPCGLIVNELITNSFKHAFPAGRSGKVQVGLAVRDAGDRVLTVEDDGVGFSAGVDAGSASTLGLRLVAVLASQLHGTVRVSREQGSRFSITFPGAENNGGTRSGT